MKTKLKLRLWVACGLLATTSPFIQAATEQTDSVSLFAYKTEPGPGGLRLAWSEDGKSWSPIGEGEGLQMVASDFGPWGSHKKMYEPRLFRTPEGWRLIFWVTDKRETLAAADSPDLVKWHPQKYAAAADSAKLIHGNMIEASSRVCIIDSQSRGGELIRISRLELNRLLANEIMQRVKDMEKAERITDDVNHPVMKLPVALKVKRNQKPAVDVSRHLFGIFFEDINYGADGGLYGELIQNRDFEYKSGENGNKEWGPSYAWHLRNGSGSQELILSTENPIHPNNATYLSIIPSAKSQTLTNTGYDGISLRKDTPYRFSIMARTSSPTSCKLKIELVKNGKTIATTHVKVSGDEWQTLNASLKPNATVADAELKISIPAGAQLDLDMISLFPADTYKGRDNGLRRDLAEALDSLHPRFVRFPGGCVAHGNGIDNIYDWKGSIGPLESRRPLPNLWGYHQTRGLGYHEYFLFCEDLGAEPLPVVAAGVPCQNSGRPWSGSHDELTTLGQQGGIPMDEMPQYIQDVLDLIEYANGPSDSTWGAKRAEAGHPDPFNLKYIGIGNEDMITEVFEERFREIFEAVKSKHPEITVIGTVGPFYEGADYDAGWELARELNVPIVDEHYYVEPGWLLNNRDFYDNYPRGGTKVYLGEYASHLPGRPNNMETALSTALYLTDVERNSDVVAMTSYAPLLAKKDHTQWRPDMIYFDNESVTLTPDYWVQRMFGTNQGDEYLPFDLQFETLNPAAARRIGCSVMRQTDTGDLIIKIVNVLPTEITLTPDFSDLIGSQALKATLTSLEGTPEESQVSPTSSVVSLESPVSLAPYSLSVLRIAATPQ